MAVALGRLYAPQLSLIYGEDTDVSMKRSEWEVNAMTEEEIRSTIRSFLTAISKGDVDGALSYFTEDGTWTNPEGSFQGKEELRRYLTWLSEGVKDMTYTESGIGLMVQGDQAAYEHEFEGTWEGESVKWLALCGYNMAEGKVRHVRTVYDRLSVVQQAARGWLEETMINAIVKRAERGLH